DDGGSTQESETATRGPIVDEHLVQVRVPAQYLAPGTFGDEVDDRVGERASGLTDCRRTEEDVPHPPRLEQQDPLDPSRRHIPRGQTGGAEVLWHSRAAASRGPVLLGAWIEAGRAAERAGAGAPRRARCSPNSSTTANPPARPGSTPRRRRAAPHRAPGTRGATGLPGTPSPIRGTHLRRSPDS